MKPSEYTFRFYRDWQKPEDLLSFSIKIKETDLQIYADEDVSEIALRLTAFYREQIEETVRNYPCFLSSLIPINISSPYDIINRMVEKSSLAGVGPMAGVAGAIAEFVGNALLSHCKELIIENGGDIFIKSSKDRKILIYAGEDSPFKNKLGIRLRGGEKPRGICTSSGQIGHSLSFGKTDATIIIAHSAITADVFATATGNIVKSEDDIDKALNFAERSGEVSGAIILIGKKIGVWGDVEFI
ncbi:MAG: UPF0280 family protein [Spirochaetota bacterium]